MLGSSTHKKQKHNNYPKSYSSDLVQISKVDNIFTMITSPNTFSSDINKIETSQQMHHKKFKFQYQQELENVVKSFSETNSDSSKLINPLSKKFNEIKRLSVIDFDNTLFCSPLPNSDIWDSRSIGLLKGDLGWFLDSRTLQKPYLSNSKKRWVKDIEKVSTEEFNRTDTLCILLTGRSDYIYHDIIRDLLSKRNISFDMVILKENPNIKWNPNNFISNKLDYYELTARNKALGIFASKASNPITFDYKMDVIADILDAFPSLDSIYMWDDRLNHCSKMQTFLENKYVSNNRIKEAKVYKVDQNTIYMDLDYEKKLVNYLVNDHNDYVDSELLRSAIDSQPQNNLPPQPDSNPDPTSPDNLTPSNSLPSTQKKDLSITRLKIEPYTRYTAVVLDQKSSDLLDSIFKTPKFWRKTEYHLFLGIGEIDDCYLAKNLGDYNFVNSCNEDPNHSKKNLKTVSFGDKVEIDVDGVGFISDTIYGLRILKTLAISDISNSNNTKITKKFRSVYNPSKLFDVGSDIDKENYSKPYLKFSSRPRFIPLCFNEAGGFMNTELLKINNFLNFSQFNTKNLKNVDQKFSVKLSKFVDLDSLNNNVRVSSLVSEKECILKLTGYITKVVRSAIVPETPVEPVKKDEVSIGNLIKVKWGDKIVGSDIGKAKKLIESQMADKQISNSDANLHLIKNLVDNLNPS
ncbi:hypothetical protein AYI69_g6135 [Smittium culicis]|uniref:Swiss Army Knife RNA repair protein HAD domain-containing protein n=1 Tax=Smittium culicis TaxID=133412 RepID=A0A1R1Y1E2_9FUNG|nr:hypothetical protein AYI69_g6135 [Smittium culicis]